MISDYLSDALCGNSLNNIIKTAYKRLKRHAHKFDAIAFTGMSGGLVAPALAAKLKKPLLMVRKGSLKGLTHSTKRVEGITYAQTYLIIDDCIATGRTIKRIKRAITKFAPMAKPVGIYMYIQYKSGTPDWVNEIVGINSEEAFI